MGRLLQAASVYADRRMLLLLAFGFSSGLPLLLVSAPLTGMFAASTGSFVVPFLCLGLVQLLAAGTLAFLRVPDEEPEVSRFADEIPDEPIP